MPKDALTTSALGRFVRLGGLIGRVGASVAGERVVDLALSGPVKQARRTKNLVRNATRIVETLGEMKGAAMKVGQMLSLHEQLLPPEAAAVLRSLQREAPRVPSEVMHWEVEGSLGAKVEELFAELEPDAYAAASIGQVHRGRLHDGRLVAVKIQYPLIDEIIRADLKNLKALLQGTVALIADLDFEPIWQELHDRLFEELDYRHEAENMRRMAELHAGVPEIVIPEVVAELSTDRVLTMELVEGIPPDEACSERYPAEQRDRWGAVLFEFQLRGLLKHRLLHADPNMSNFAFLQDGGIVVYDFGCLKEIPDWLAAGYRRLFRAALAGRSEEVPEILLSIGIALDGEPLPLDVVARSFDLFSEFLREAPPYTFGEDEDLYGKVLEIGLANWSKAAGIRFPQDMVFVDRALSGNFGNLIRLRATGPWRELVERYASRASV